MSKLMFDEKSLVDKSWTPKERKQMKKENPNLKEHLQLADGSRIQNINGSMILLFRDGKSEELLSGRIVTDGRKVYLEDKKSRLLSDSLSKIATPSHLNPSETI